MNKKLAVIGAAILVVGALVVVSIWRSPGGAGSPSAQNPSASSSQLPQAAQAIIQSGDAAKCASVNSVVGGVNYETVCRNNIAWNAAQANLDISACNGLDNKLMSIADCQDSVVGKLVAKNKTLTVCDQFAGDLKNVCVSDYWSVLAAAQHDPSQCLHLGASGSQADLSCENNVLLSALSVGTSTPQCSLFNGAAKTDCTNYAKGNCQTFAFPLLQNLCLQKRK
jgi:hypothetical protein